MCTVPKPYPKKFRNDVVNVARRREQDRRSSRSLGTSVARIRVCVIRMLQADVEDGHKSGTTAAGNTELPQASQRIRLLEQENEVLRPAAAYLSQANRREKALPARKELATDGIPVAV
jgi:transposase